jgi:DNA-binding CsgD family transcriptional regulator
VLSFSDVAETIENNVRKLIIDEQPINPKYYEKMSELLNALIQQRRQNALDYQKYLEADRAAIEDITRKISVPVVQGKLAKDGFAIEFEAARRLGLRPFLDCLQSDIVPAAPLLSEDVSRPAAAIGLTPRQRSILGLIAKGLTNKEIASHLNLSARTIEMHVALALERLNCRTRSEEVSRAISQGLLGSKTSS